MLVRVSRIRRIAGVLAVPALLFFVTADAQSTRQRLDDLEARLARLERILQNSQTNQTQMLGRLSELQTENQELRNQLETLQFESGKSGDRERELYMDLDTRLQAVEARGSAPGAVAGGAAGAGAAAAGGGNDQQAYQLALGLLREGRYAEAEAAFSAFLGDYPYSDLRDNAQYWQAEALYVTKKFNNALVGFQKVITDYPQSRKLPDAWLKVGYCNFELARWDDARKALATAARQFPDTSAGKLAQERLAKMDAGGL